MLSINTNIPSLIAQRSLNNSTKLLNQAIERMTTGFKINHASDNAANFSITTNMNTNLSSYQVAEDNVAMGLDLLSTAGGSLDLISDKLSRLRALAEQSVNGTYGDQSLKAINSEANAIVDEIERIYSTAEYNGIKLLGEIKPPLMQNIQQLTEKEAIEQGYTIIRTAEDLHKMDNSGGKFIMMNDIDLSEYNTSNGWNPIPDFNGTFDGNGYVISNLYINSPNGTKKGLFANTGYQANLNNIALENVNVTGKSYVGGLVGDSFGSITNSYVVGTVSGNSYIGGLAGAARGSSDLENNYAICDVSGSIIVGGLLGAAGSALTISNNYSSGTVPDSGSEISDFIGNLPDSLTIDSSSGAVAEEDIPILVENKNAVTFQIGINSDNASSITIDTAFDLRIFNIQRMDISNTRYLDTLDTMINRISAKQTEFGAAENRLESALEEISTQYDNLISSRSTLRDADIAEVSSEYIRQQILQQASATLLATANQSPSLALQLL